MKLLVTGAAGFIGSTFVRTVLDTRPDDEIVVLDGGVVRERGTHAALLRLGGLYAEMWNRQAQESAEQALAAE